MTVLAEKIYGEALDLPSDERLGLIDKLLESISPSSLSIQQAWIAEAEKRLAEYRAGEVLSVSGEEIFQKIHARLNK